MNITPDELKAFLSSQMQAEITAIEPVQQGEWSQTYCFNANQRRLVIRFSAYDEDFRKDRFAAQFSSPRLPVPPVETLGEAFDRFYAITPYVDGKMIDHFDAAEMRAAVPAIVDLFNALRAVDSSRFHGYGGIGPDGNGGVNSWRDFLTQMTADTAGSRLQGWRQNLAGNPFADGVYRQARTRLLELVPLCPETRHLIHNDLLHFNLIMQGNRVAAVIDWGCALWGDFLYDLAMFTTWQFYYPAMDGIDFPGELERSLTAQNVVQPHFYERLQCYQLHLLLDGLAYNAWKGDPINLELTAGRLSELLK